MKRIRICTIWLLGTLLVAALHGQEERFPRFHDRGNGTIVDREANHIWQKCGRGQGVIRGACTGRAELVDWYSAAHYCDELGLVGISWRLPTIEELESLVDRARDAGPLLDLRVFPATFPFHYWSSESYLTENGTFGRALHFTTGVAYGEAATDLKAVRCIADR